MATMMLKRKGVVIVSISALLCLCFVPNSKPYNEAAAAYYDAVLDTLQQQLMVFKSSSDKRSPFNTLKAEFFRCRNTYKHISFFTEHFDSRGARLLNGPDLLRIEDDTQQDSTRPHGFQHIESILFAPLISYKALSQEIAVQLQSTATLRHAPDHQYAFRDDRIWEALRLGTYRIISLGITGFDVPLSRHALPEARENLTAIRQIGSMYREQIEAAKPGLWHETDAAFTAAIACIKPTADFNSFDRLTFIRDYINPLSGKLKACAFAIGAVNGKQLTPLNPDADNLFAANIFNIDFFSPTDRYRLTADRAVLGRRLFYDTRLSATNTRSCATCHKPELAFTDGLPKATPISGKGELRNTPTLLNSALQTRQFYDSRALVLETQLDAVVHSREEMGGSLHDAIAILAADTLYPALFAKAYSGEQKKITQYNIANAIASYIRTLISFNAPFDKYIRGQNDAIGTNEKRGFNLFMGKAGCGTCHYAPMFNGLVPPRYEETESEILAVPASNRRGALLDADEGKYRHTGTPLHKYAFKTPTLRNIALTAPYMHNGAFRTLAEVVDFYDNGGGAGAGIKLETQSLPADRLRLNKQEKLDLIAFMKSLTDTVGLTAHPVP